MTAALLGAALHACTRCTPNHYDNCRACFGFGLRAQSVGEYHPPISAHVASEMRAMGAEEGDGWITCPCCKSTIHGIPLLESLK